MSVSLSGVPTSSRRHNLEKQWHLSSIFNSVHPLPFLFFRHGIQPGIPTEPSLRVDLGPPTPPPEDALIDTISSDRKRRRTISSRVMIELLKPITYFALRGGHCLINLTSRTLRPRQPISYNSLLASLAFYQRPLFRAIVCALSIPCFITITWLVA